jgi:hypothetical protein
MKKIIILILTLFLVLPVFAENNLSKTVPQVLTISESKSFQRCQK